MLTFIGLALFYAVAIFVWFCVVATALVLYVTFVAIVFVLTAVCMGIRWLFRSEWPRNPRPPQSSRAVPQARWSNRR